MKSIQCMSLVFCLLSIHVVQVQSAEVIEPDYYNDGTELNEIYPGVQLSVTAYDNQIVDTWSVTATVDHMGYAPTGQKVFAYDNIFFWFYARHLRMDFSQAISSVSLIAGGADVPRFTNRTCQGILEVYDIDFKLLDVYQTDPLLAGQKETMEIYRSQNDIYYAVAYTTGENPFGRLDHLEFVIPEPTTLFLLAFGTVFMGRMRKKEVSNCL